MYGLHLGEQVTEVLAVAARLAAALHPAIVRSRQRRFREHGPDARVPAGLDRCEIRTDPRRPA